MYNIQCILFDHISHTFMTLFSSIVILYKQKIIGTCVRLCVCGYEHRKQIKIRVKQTKEFKKYTRRRRRLQILIRFLNVIFRILNQE